MKEGSERGLEDVARDVEDKFRDSEKKVGAPQGRRQCCQL